MTKKDYELLAEAVSELYMGHSDWQRSLGQVANKLADKLEADNPKFNRMRFLIACGLDMGFLGVR